MSEKQETDQTQLLLSCGLFFLTAFLFAPTTLWLVEQTIYFDQLKHAFMILGLAGVYLMMENRQKLGLILKFDTLATGLLVSSFLALALNQLLQSALVLVIAYCLAIAAWIIFVFGGRLTRIVLALLAAFSAYVVLALYQPLFDWPLRAIAGEYAARMLVWMGHSVQLALAESLNPKLIMLVDGYPFEVAAECNGFGMISGCILLSILLVCYRRVRIFDKLLAIVLSGLIAMVFNIARILVICLLAPTFRESYFLMHEIVGSIFFWGALAVVWWIDQGLHTEKSQGVRAGKHVVFFDGECFMCNKSMRFLLNIDRQQRLWFAPLQGKTAEQVIKRRDNLDFDLKSIILVENLDTEHEQVSLRSTAVLKAMESTGGVWMLAGVFLWVPAIIRDAVYNFVAKNRIKWFGKTEMCSLIPSERQERLLD
ncbi:MAG: archaeosortase/exosortase family protein [Verrucomicrobiota bacterium]